MVSVRDSCLRCLQILVNFVDVESKRLWVAKFDIVCENRKLAEAMWEDAGLGNRGLETLAEDLLQAYMSG